MQKDFSYQIRFQKISSNRCQHFRKNFAYSHQGKNIDINIVSLSVGGVGFIVNENFCWKQEDVFEIIFQLDDDDGAVICEEISIKYSNGQFVGAEFYYSDRYNYELDFYLMSKTLDA